MHNRKKKTEPNPKVIFFLICLSIFSIVCAIVVSYVITSYSDINTVIEESNYSSNIDIHGRWIIITDNSSTRICGTSINVFGTDNTISGINETDGDCIYKIDMLDFKDMNITKSNLENIIKKTTWAEHYE